MKNKELNNESELEQEKETKEKTLKKEKKSTEEKCQKDKELLNAKYDELEDKYKRVLAEFENYKKRTEKEKIRTYDLAKVDIVEKLLPVIDSLESAKGILKDEKYIEGLDQVYKQIEEFLNKNNIEEIPTVGEPFDPELHDAVSIVESDKEEGIIIEEFRKGYKMGNNIIRHSMVIVSK